MFKKKKKSIFDIKISVGSPYCDFLRPWPRSACLIREEFALFLQLILTYGLLCNALLSEGSTVSDQPCVYLSSQRVLPKPFPCAGEEGCTLLGMQSFLFQS